MSDPVVQKKGMSLKIKYTLILNLVVGGLFLGIGSFIYVNLRSRDEIQGKSYMEALGGQYAWRTKNLLEEALFSTRSLALTLSSFDSIPRESRRSVFLTMSRQILESNKRWIGVWIQWEPNRLDGLDDRFVNQNLAGAGTETGAFAPYWTRGPDGIKLETSRDEHYLADYYIIPRDLGHEFLTEPYYDEPQGVKTLMVTAAAPIYDRRGVFQGVVGIDYSLDALVEELGQLKLYDTGFGRLISPEGVVAYHPFKERIGKKAPEWEGEKAASFIQKIEEGLSFTEKEFSKALNAFTMKSFIPFSVGRTNQRWVYGAVVPLTEFYQESDSFAQFFILSFLTVMFILVLILLFVIDSFMRPLIRIGISMKEFALGEADLRVRLVTKGGGELAQLSQSFNLFIEGLGKIVLQIREQMKNLDQISAQLEKNMDSIGIELDKVQTNIKNMKQTADVQSSTVMEMSSTVEQIVGNLNSLNQQIERQNQTLSNSASAVEEMVANIQNMTRNIDVSMNSITKLKTVSDQGYEKLEEVNEVIRNISAQSDGLQEANSIINNIASQTNLLAMNAAIEAAHAGEAGKGFAVVADEIRKLAEESANRSRDINQLLKSLHQFSEQAVASSSDAGSAFEAIRKSVDEVINRQMEIRTSAEQQNVGNKQVLEGVHQLKQIAAEVELGSREMATGSQSMLKLVLGVVEGARKVQEAIAEISQATFEIAETAQITIDNSRRNKFISNGLDNLVKRFKI